MIQRSIVTLALIGTAVLLLAGCRGSQAGVGNFQTARLGRSNLTVTIDGQGLVRPRQTAVLVWKTSGLVENVDVRVGAPVRSGDKLASLSDTSLSQEVLLAQANLAAAQKAVDDLRQSQVQRAQAMQEVEDAQHSLEDLQASGAGLAEAQEKLASAQKTVDNAERQWEILSTPPSAEAIEQARANMLMAENVLNRTLKNIDRIEKKLAKPERFYWFFESRKMYRRILKNLEIKRASDQVKYYESRQRYENLVNPKNPNDIAVARAALDTAIAQRDAAQREWERVKGGPSEAELSLAQARLAEAQRKLQRLQDGADPYDLAAAEARLAAAQAALKLPVLQAPFDGQVTRVDIQPGDVARPGQPALRLDDLSGLLVDVQVSELDINAVRPGEQAVLTFDSIRNREYHGEVTEVGQVGEADESGVNFTVTVKLADADEQVKPGMTAVVTITAGELKDVLAVPNEAVRTVEGSRAVYVMREGTLTPIPVELGQSSETHSQVVAGDLKEGDEIVLNPPFFSQDDFGPPPGRRF